jgi:Tfp pilus assembly protein FimV
MNPHIANIENLEVGQSIFLPEKPMKMKNDRTKVKAPASAPKTASAGEFYYKVKRGDTLYKIIRREFKVSETSIPQVVRSIKVLNPTIKNVNKIYVGTMLKLPGKTVFVQSPDDLTPATRKPAISDTAEQYVQADRIIEIKDKKMMPLEAVLLAEADHHADEWKRSQQRAIIIFPSPRPDRLPSIAPRFRSLNLTTTRPFFSIWKTALTVI